MAETATEQAPTEPEQSGERPVEAPHGARRGLRRWQRVLIVGAGIGAVAVAGVGLSMQSPLPVGGVVVEGASPDLQPLILAEVGPTDGLSFSGVDAGAVEQRLVAIDGIESADLSWGWWNELKVSVVEQEPAGLFADGKGGFTVVDAQGNAIRTVSARPAGLLVVEAGDAAGRAIGLQVAGQVPPEFAAGTDAVVVEGPQAVTLRMGSGAVVVLGSADSVPDKVQLAQQLLAGTGAGLVNVSVPGAPAVSQLPPPPEP